MKHVEDVADIAVRFAKVYNLDVAKVKLAALCHDIRGVMTPQEMYDFAIAKGLNIDPAEEEYHALLHQRISRIMVQEEYGITGPDVLNAVECHTTLRKNASIYDKVVFIAGKISWTQEGVHSYDNLLNSPTTESLNEACYLYIKYQFDNDLLVMPHRWLIEAFEDLHKSRTGSNISITN